MFKLWKLESILCLPYSGNKVKSIKSTLIILAIIILGGSCSRRVDESSLHIVDITEENISHVQHEEKKLKASFISTGELLRQTEKPAIVSTPPAINHGTIAPAESGNNDKNTRNPLYIKGFRVFAISLTTLWSNYCNGAFYLLFYLCGVISLLF